MIVPATTPSPSPTTRLPHPQPHPSTNTEQLTRIPPTSRRPQFPSHRHQARRPLRILRRQRQRRLPRREGKQLRVGDRAPCRRNSTSANPPANEKGKPFGTQWWAYLHPPFPHTKTAGPDPPPCVAGQNSGTPASTHRNQHPLEKAKRGGLCIPRY